MSVPQSLLDLLNDVQAKKDAYDTATANVATAQQSAQTVADQAKQHLLDAEAAFQAGFQSAYPAS